MAVNMKLNKKKNITKMVTLKLSDITKMESKKALSRNIIILVS